MVFLKRNKPTKKIIMVDTMSMITTNMVLNKGLVHTKKTIMVVMICTDITSMVSKKKLVQCRDDKKIPNNNVWDFLFLVIRHLSFVTCHSSLVIHCST